MPLPRQERKYSYADYLTWNEDERWEVLEGIAYMQAAPSRIHQEIPANCIDSSQTIYKVNLAEFIVLHSA